MPSFINFIKQYQIIDDRIREINFQIKQVHSESMNDLLKQRDLLMELKETMLEADMRTDINLSDVYASVQECKENTSYIINSRESLIKLPIFNYNSHVIFYIDKSLPTMNYLKYNGQLMELGRALREMINIWRSQIGEHNSIASGIPLNFTYSIVPFTNSFYTSPQPHYTVTYDDNSDFDSLFNRIYDITPVNHNLYTTHFLTAIDNTIGTTIKPNAVNTIFYISDLPFPVYDGNTNYQWVKDKIYYYQNANTKVRLYGIYPTSYTPNMIYDYPFFPSNQVKNITDAKIDLRQWAYNVLGV